MAFNPGLWALDFGRDFFYFAAARIAVICLEKSAQAVELSEVIVMIKNQAAPKTGVTKQCYRCRAVKDASEFHKYSRNKDGLQPYCRPCKREIDNEHYRTHPRRNYERNKAKAQSNRKWFYEYLRTKQCEWEGCNVSDPDMLVLDHLDPRNKRSDVSAMVHTSFGLKTIQEEVAKCRVLCANHHQKHTIQQFGYRKWLDES